MLILGIDPGTATTGFGLIKSDKRPVTSNKKRNLSLVAYGCISTSKDWEMPKRLWALQSQLKKILLEHRPDVICVEQLFFGANARTAMTVGQARGVVMAQAAAQRVPLFEYQGLAIKHKLCGYGRADKKEVERGVKKILGVRKLEKPQNGYLDDAVDALAIAIYHFLKISS